MSKQKKSDANVLPSRKRMRSGSILRIAALLASGIARLVEGVVARDLQVALEVVPIARPIGLGGLCVSRIRRCGGRCRSASPRYVLRVPLVSIPMCDNLTSRSGMETRSDVDPLGQNRA
jgi:hypothetical protein